MRGASLVGAIATAGLALAGPALALPFVGKKAPAAKAAPASAAAPQAAQSPPAPATAAGALDIKGFRSATFGMTPAQVKAAVAADFGRTAKLQEGANSDGTHFVLAAVEQLDPGPGPAQIGYVFGAASKTLSAVNVVWKTAPDATAQQREAIAQAGQQLAAYFRAGPAPAKASEGVGTFGTNGLLLYSAVDSKNAAVNVLVDGVAYQGSSGDKQITSPPPTGPASLRVAYLLSAEKPDVKALKPGSF